MRRPGPGSKHLTPAASELPGGLSRGTPFSPCPLGAPGPPNGWAPPLSVIPKPGGRDEDGSHAGPTWEGPTGGAGTTLGAGMGDAVPEPQSGGSCLVDEFDGERKEEAQRGRVQLCRAGAAHWTPAVLL